MKVLLEDNESEFNELEDSDIYNLNGVFHTFDGTNYIPVPPSIQSALKKEYDKQKREERANQQGIDLKAAEEKDKERLSHAGSMTVDDLEKEQSNYKKAQLYKRAQQSKEAERRREEIRKSAIQSSSDIKSLTDELGAQIKDFVSNQVRKKPVVTFRNTYDEPDPYETVDPRIFTQGRTAVHQMPDEGKQKEQKPLVLFYFDRSNSFDPKYAPEKTQLGKDIQKMFDMYSDKLDIKTFYFGSFISENEKDVLNTGNDGNVLLKHIAAQTADRLANVVILTDSDNSNVRTVIKIQGSVWLIFAASYDGGALAGHIRLEGKKSIMKQFFFKNIK